VFDGQHLHLLDHPDLNRDKTLVEFGGQCRCLQVRYAWARRLVQLLPAPLRKVFEAWRIARFRPRHPAGPTLLSWLPEAEQQDLRNAVLWGLAVWAADGATEELDWNDVWESSNELFPYELELRAFREWAAGEVLRDPQNLTPDAEAEVGHEVLLVGTLYRLQREGLLTVQGKPSYVTSVTLRRGPRFDLRVRAMGRSVDAAVGLAVALIQDRVVSSHRAEDESMAAVLRTATGGRSLARCS
jgi:hypothetical protein